MKERMKQEFIPFLLIFIFSQNFFTDYYPTEMMVSFLVLKILFFGFFNENLGYRKLRSILLGSK